MECAAADSMKRLSTQLRFCPNPLWLSDSSPWFILCASIAETEFRAGVNKSYTTVVV